MFSLISRMNTYPSYNESDAVTDQVGTDSNVTTEALSNIVPDHLLNSQDSSSQSGLNRTRVPVVSKPATKVNKNRDPSMKDMLRQQKRFDRQSKVNV